MLTLRITRYPGSIRKRAASSPMRLASEKPAVLPGFLNLLVMEYFQAGVRKIHGSIPAFFRMVGAHVGGCQWSSFSLTAYIKKSMEQYMYLLYESLATCLRTAVCCRWNVHAYVSLTQPSVCQQKSFDPCHTKRKQIAISQYPESRRSYAMIGQAPPNSCVNSPGS
jgi:hypothetical protein